MPSSLQGNKLFHKYKEGQDVQDFFATFEPPFATFEHTCHHLEILEDKYMSYVIPPVEGTPRAVLVELGIEEDNDYNLYRQRVRQQVGLGREMCRKKFQALTYQPKDSYTQFAYTVQTH